MQYPSYYPPQDPQQQAAAREAYLRQLQHQQLTGNTDLNGTDNDLGSLVAEYREKHPELQDFELYIDAEVNHFLNESFQHGKNPSARDAIETGIARFQQKLQQATQRRQNNTVPGNDPNTSLQNANQTTGNAKNINRMALNMDLNASPVTVAKLTADDIWHMPQEQFEALERRISKQHYR